MLKKISKNTVAAQVINQLTELIRGGSLKPGDKLPSERLMAEELGVSRPPLRESLRALEYAGVIETRYGDGIYVKSGDFPNAAAPLIFRLLNQYSLEEMVEMRKIIETSAVRLAAERATEDDLESIREIQNRTQDCLGDMDKFIECDFAFHSAIAESTRNSLLFNTVQTMRKMMNEFNEELLNGEKQREEVWRQHAQILSCIEKKNTPQAVKAMNKHLDNVLSQNAGGANTQKTEKQE